MKKTYYIMAITAMMLTACSSEDDALTNFEENQGITVYAQLPQEITTRVSYADESAGSTYSVKPSWSSGDYIRHAYKSASGDKIGNKLLTINGSIGTFTLATEPKNPSYVYCWHYTNANSASMASDATVSTCSLTPSTNKDWIYSYVNAYTQKNLLVGVFYYDGTETFSSAHEITFKNAYALLKFQVKLPSTATGNLSYAKIMGWNGSAATNVGVAGTVTITGSSGNLAWDNTTSSYYEATRNISGTFGTSGDYKTATFYALVTPQTFNGLYLEVKDAADTPVTYTYKANGNVELQAGYMYGIKAKMTKVE